MNQSEEIKSAEDILAKHSVITTNKWVANKSELISIMREYHNQFKSEWVSVEDRLPEPHHKVLTFNGYIGVNWNNGKDWVMFGGVTHWQALPTPPKV